MAEIRTSGWHTRSCGAFVSFLFLSMLIGLIGTVAAGPSGVQTAWTNILLCLIGIRLCCMPDLTSIKQLIAAVDRIDMDAGPDFREATN